MANPVHSRILRFQWNLLGGFLRWWKTPCWRIYLYLSFDGPSVQSGGVQYRVVEAMLVAYILSILPLSFVMESWFLAKHMLHRIRTVFYSLSDPKAATWGICRSVGEYFWGVFLKLKVEPFLDLVSPGMWYNSWCFSSYPGLWVSLKRKGRWEEGRAERSKQPEAVIIVWSRSTFLGLPTIRHNFCKRASQFVLTPLFCRSFYMQWDEMLQIGIHWQVRLGP